MTMRRLAGILLILGSIVFLVGVSRPVIEEVFDAVVTGDVQTQIQAMLVSPGQWRFANLMMGFSTCFSATGLIFLAAYVRRTKPSRQLVILGYTAAGAMTIAALAFLLICYNRVTLPPEVLATSRQDIPNWASTTYDLTSAVGILLFGYVLIRSASSRWGGAVMVLVELGLLALTLLAFGEIIPAIHYLPLMIGGVALLFSGQQRGLVAPVANDAGYADSSGRV
jgi:hypothetical protein